MENANLRFLAEMLVDLLEDSVMVADQSRHAVIFQIADCIPTVVSQVVDDEVEVLGQVRPERIVEVDGQTIAVAEDQSNPIGVAVAAKQNRRLGTHIDFVNSQRFGDAPDCILLRHDDGLTS